MKKILALLLIIPALAFGQTVQLKSANVKFTGGAIDGTTIGATTPAVVSGTTATFTGNVGVGSAVPLSRLEVRATGSSTYNGSDQLTVNSQTSGNRAEIHLTDNLTSDALISFLPSATAGSRRLCLSSNTVETDFCTNGLGNTLIGTTTDNGAKLQVNGGMTATTGSFSDVITSTVSTGTAPFTVASTTVVANLKAATATTATNLSGGTVSGTTGAFSGAVTLPGLASSSAATTGTLCWTTGTGNVNVDTTTTCLLSARKYKQDITDLGRAMPTVMALRPVSYQLRPEFNPDKLGRQVGFIGDEVQKVDPRFVSLDSNGEAHAVRYQQMTALLVKAIQEQQKQINKLQKQSNKVK